MQTAKYRARYYETLVQCPNCHLLYPKAQQESVDSALCVQCLHDIDLWPLKEVGIEQDPRFAQ